MLDGTDRHRFPQRFVLKVPAGLPAAIELAARRKLTTAAHWARAALLEALEADGIHLNADGRIATPTPDTHAEEELRA